MKDYRLEVKVKNNIFYKTMIKNKYYSLAELSRASGVSQNELSKIMNLKMSVYKVSKEGHEEMRPAYQKLCDFFYCEPEDLSPLAHLYDALYKNKTIKEIDIGEMETVLLDRQQTPDKLIEQQDLQKTISKALCGLTPREERVLRMRFGLDGSEPMTLEEVGKAFGVTSARIRSIEGKAIHKLKHPYRVKLLREFTYD